MCFFGSNPRPESYARFIENDRDANVGSMTGKRKEREGQLRLPAKKINTQSLPATKVQSPSKAFPKSLSVLEMLKLGKVINEKSTERIELYTFDLAEMAWSSQPSAVEFSITNEPFGKGGFHEAYKATSKAPECCRQQWAVKKYLQSTVDIIKETKQTIEQHTKVVQMHMLARNFTQKLEKELKEGENLELYGETLTYSCTSVFSWVESMGKQASNGLQWKNLLMENLLNTSTTQEYPVGWTLKYAKNVKVWHTFRMSIQMRI